MPTPGPIAINKSALNALVDLYYLYGEMVIDACNTEQSFQELDVFYRNGGLKQMIEKYYRESNIDPIAAGDAGGPLTLDRLLPRPTISAVVGREVEEISHLRGLLKGYFDGFENIYGTPYAEDATEVVRQGKAIITARRRRRQSTAESSLVDLATALIAYERHKLKIGNVEMIIRRNTLEDHVLEYMINCCNKGEAVDRTAIANWITRGTTEVISGKSIYDKCVYINKKIQDQLGTTLKLFDTSGDNQIKRNY